MNNRPFDFPTSYRYALHIPIDQLIKSLAYLGYNLPTDAKFYGAGTNKSGQLILLLYHPTFPYCPPGQKAELLEPSRKIIESNRTDNPDIKEQR